MSQIPYILAAIDDPVFTIFPTHVFYNFLKPVTAIFLVMGQNADKGLDADTGLLPTY